MKRFILPLIAAAGMVLCVLYAGQAQSAVNPDAGTILIEDAKVCMTADDAVGLVGAEGASLDKTISDEVELLALKNALVEVGYGTTPDDFPFDRIDFFSWIGNLEQTYVILYEEGCVVNYFWDDNKNIENILELAFGKEVQN